MQPYLKDLETIIQASGEKLEGNLLYQPFSFTLSEKQLPKQRNLEHLLKNKNKIIDIGFNAGHSCLFFLIHNPECTIECFDIGEHAYSRDCFEYLFQKFPNRLTMHWGDTKDTLFPFVVSHSNPFDLIHLDGSQDSERIEKDLQMVRFLGDSNTIFVLNDTQNPSVHSVLKNWIDTSRVKEISPLCACNEYLHSIFYFPRCEIALLSLTIGETFKQITQYSTAVKILYCNQHHYDFIREESIHDPERPPAWSKIKLIQKYLPFYTSVVWMDSDLYIMNPSIPLEHFKIHKSMLVGYDWKMINTGVWFIKPTPFSFDFLSFIYSQQDCIEHGNWEQTAFIKGYEENWNQAQTEIEKVYHTEFNSYWYNFEKGHFILHFCGARQHPALKSAMDTYCPIQQFGENVEMYERRIWWIENKARDCELEKLKSWQ